MVLNEHDPETDSANFRIALRGPAWYGRGLGSEATRLVVDHALRTMGLQRLTLGVLARNPRARRAYEKAGFRRVRDYVEDGEDWVEMEVRRSHLDPDYPLLTERLLLRPIDPVRDVAAMHSYRSRADVCRYTPLVPGTVERARRAALRPRAHPLGDRRRGPGGRPGRRAPRHRRRDRRRGAVLAQRRRRARRDRLRAPPRPAPGRASRPRRAGRWSTSRSAGSAPTG